MLGGARGGGLGCREAHVCGVKLTEGALHVLARLAAEAPDLPCIAVDGHRLSRRQLLEQVGLWAGALARQGVRTGDQIAIITPNCLDWYIAFWAIVSLGAVPVPLDPQVGAWELERLWAILDIRLCLAWSRYRSVEISENLLQICATRATPCTLVCLDRSVPGTLTRDEFLGGSCPLPVPSRSLLPDERLMLACTSGTTGNPKIIVVPHAGFVRAQLDMAETLALGPRDRMLLGMPLYHQGGFGMGLQVLLAGGEAMYFSRFEPQAFLDAVQTHAITVVQLSATLAKILLSHPELSHYDLRTIRLAYFAGEVLPDAVAAEFWKDRAIRVVNVIGSSETATMVMWDSNRDHQRSASEYRPLPHTHIRVGGWDPDAREAHLEQPGSLWVSTDALLLEYYGNANETTRRLVVREGRRWFDSEDLVLALADGYVRFVGRIKRALKRGPNLVHPEEVESYLLTHPQIAAVAVAREDHELYGDAIVAWIQPAPQARLTRGDLLQFCRGKIAAYKIPDRFVIVERLPIDIGKVQYKHLRTNEIES